MGASRFILTVTDDLWWPQTLMGPSRLAWIDVHQSACVLGNFCPFQPSLASCDPVILSDLQWSEGGMVSHPCLLSAPKACPLCPPVIALVTVGSVFSAFPTRLRQLSTISSMFVCCNHFIPLIVCHPEGDWKCLLTSWVNSPAYQPLSQSILSWVSCTLRDFC